ncbi:GyrI-like domain-containing protein [Micrococcoides hystricis]|uniref:GyrI-like domain-containing protein n=1 Tax=Micrococcoides hystricis TaxID=1572761 RepID=A0ABV6PBN2_9MICC
MSIDLKIITLTEVPTAVVRGDAIMADQLTDFYDHAFSSVFAALTSLGIQPTGPAFGLYTAMEQGEVPTFGLEVGVPVSAPLAESIHLPGHDPVHGSILPGGRVATTSHRGNYAGLSHAWTEFLNEAQTQGLVPADPMWEVYVTEPSPEADPNSMVTELYFSLK